MDIALLKIILVLINIGTLNSKGCIDSPNWSDLRGFTCQNYTQFGNCSDRQFNGNYTIESAEGITLADACCGCGRTNETVLGSWLFNFLIVINCIVCLLWLIVTIHDYKTRPKISEEMEMPTYSTNQANEEKSPQSYEGRRKDQIFNASRDNTDSMQVTIDLSPSSDRDANNLVLCTSIEVVDGEESGEDSEEEEMLVGTTADDAAQIIANKSDKRYLVGLKNEEQVISILKSSGIGDIKFITWNKMNKIWEKSMGAQLTTSKFAFRPKLHRFPDIYPYDFNAMPGYMGSWMGDCFGLMQWPMPGIPYNNLLRNVITKNNVGMIIALGKQEKHQRKEMISYWKQLGKTFTETNGEYCIIREITDIPPNNHSCTLYQLPEWPDRGSPTQHRAAFDFLFEKIAEIERSRKRVLIHCRAGVGRSGTLRLMYKAWKKELNSDSLGAALHNQRALRMWTVQTQLQYNFLQYYVRNLQNTEEDVMENKTGQTVDSNENKSSEKEENIPASTANDESSINNIKLPL